MEKIYPKVGDQLYLSQRTGNCYIDMVKEPYTVIEVTKGHVYIQSCKLVFNGKRYYDTLPDQILPDSEGEIIKLSWAPKRGRWQIDRSGYPQIAYFGRYEYYPYLN